MEKMDLFVLAAFEERNKEQEAFLTGTNDKSLFLMAETRQATATIIEHIQEKRYWQKV
jgi:hypothetical protein